MSILSYFVPFWESVKRQFGCEKRNLIFFCFVVFGDFLLPFLRF
jgi:hypothetical protein